MNKIHITSLIKKLIVSNKTTKIIIYYKYQKTKIPIKKGEIKNVI